MCARGDTRVRPYRPSFTGKVGKLQRPFKIILKIRSILNILPQFKHPGTGKEKSRRFKNVEERNLPGCGT